MTHLMNAVTAITLLLMLTVPVMAADRPVALFDHGHNQRFQIGKEGPLQLSGLAGVFTDQGFAVKAHDGALDADTLAGTGALVISGAFKQFTQAELDSVAAFLNRGGKLAIMLHIGPPLVPLLDMLGVVVSGSVLHEQENLIKADDINFKVTRFEPDSLTSDLEQFAIFGGWALLNEGAGTVALAKTGDKAWIDLNGDRKLSSGDAEQSFAVIVSGSYGAGRFVVFADDAIFQNQYLEEYNAKLAANLARWMK
ncbi:hypothetical protein OR1_01237 [Geobacter sp. OR-1]|uniref:DUF4350 domain-containing protein n=1 Tax=Geobacter sp. OR-1 TaxID=1266765 RepID=UPI000541DFA3|nr:DUF4350 domain-containing protein [Geobacter sp. OR-1]GAM08963.1 hypothetical protein OR1_01237 [Geobacter sp. OR-1]